MTNLITEHMDIWTATQIQKSNGGRGRGNNSNGQSVYGIKKLRELILELAVRGKLVPQDLNDEPASVLLEKIAKEKKRLIKEGKIKKEKPLPEIGEDEKPFELPVGWKWIRLGVFSEIMGGKRLPSGHSFSPAKTPYIYIQVTNMKGGTITKDNLKYISEETHSEISRYTISKGDLYITIAGTIGDVGLVPADFDGMNLTENAAKIVFSEINKIWLQKALSSKALQQQFTEKTNQLAQPKLAIHRVASSCIALPPLAEQHRIVVKVDELMALCDQLEQQQIESSDTHQTLVETLLSTLTHATDQKEYTKTWQRMADHFDTLFSTEQSIDQLKQTILQLAVMGKLVPQDPNDEPASMLLEKISKEKKRLIEERKIKKEKSLPEITEDEKPFDLPEGWAWARIGDASIFTEYGMSEKTFDGIDGIPVLKMGDIQGGTVILGGQKLVPINVEGLSSLLLKRWDLLYNRTNSAELVGKTGIYDGPDGAYTFASYLIRIRCSEECVHPKYLNLSMNTPLFRVTQIEPHLKQQCGQANVNATIMRNMIVPIPPIDEQDRIVAKVDELMALCDTLKARLNDAQTTRIQLADAIVEQAVLA
jgi:type I restriction enzyme, S subunit